MNFSKYFFRNTSEYFNFKIFGWQHITILFIGIGYNIYNKENCCK